LTSDDNISVIFLEKEFFPYTNFWLNSNTILRKARYVCDYDDAWFHAYDKHSSRIIRCLFHDKIAKVMANAYAVTVGSKYLYEYACKYNPNVYLIPTAINLVLYPGMPPQQGSVKPFQIGWIGSYSSTPFLKIVEPVLEEFCSTHDARFVVIGGNKGALQLRFAHWIPWAESTEVENLSKIDVGIMPLPDTPQSRGKCAFKLIQYMGCWKPVIASPVGENIRVVQDGKNGFLAATPQDWWNALCRLYDDHTLRESMGIAGRAIVEKSYSLSMVAPRLEAIIRSAVREDE
jgi:glycosyltransferase involved in cell wall biosynthesis